MDNKKIKQLKINQNDSFKNKKSENFDTITNTNTKKQKNIFNKTKSNPNLNIGM